MKIVWKGSMNEQNLFVYPGLPENARKLVSDRSAWASYLLIIPVLIFTYIGIKLRLPYAAGPMFAKWALIVGTVLSLPFLAVHEFIHAACCPKASEIFLYLTSAGICLIPTCPLSKRRYLMMAIMPAVILGICPFLIWLLAPGLDAQTALILFVFSVGSLSMCVGDVYNVILAAAKMTPESVFIPSGKGCLYFRKS